MNLFAMNVPEMPKKDFLLHNKVKLLTEDQRLWWDAMVRLNDVLSLTMRNHVERTTGLYLPMLFTEFLDCLYQVTHTERLCGQEFVFDEFINIATFSVPALKHIVSSPSTRIVKHAEKVHVLSLRQTSSSTMQWMAKRPGRTVQEKIAPQNKVMTSVTHFSADTKENREAMYLYNILHDLVRERLTDVHCLTCEKAKQCGVPTKDIRDLLKLHTKIRQGELADVRPEKQSIQNNKLMCDVHYKMIWDGVKRLSRIEESLTENWLHLKERYMQLGYWIVLAQLLHDRDVVILDQYGKLADKGGCLQFLSDDGEPVPNHVLLYPRTMPWQPFHLGQEDGTISFWGGDPWTELYRWNMTHDEDQAWFSRSVITDGACSDAEKKAAKEPEPHMLQGTRVAEPVLASVEASAKTVPEGDNHMTAIEYYPVYGTKKAFKKCPDCMKELQINNIPVETLDGKTKKLQMRVCSACKRRYLLMDSLSSSIDLSQFKMKAVQDPVLEAKIRETLSAQHGTGK